MGITTREQQILVIAINIYSTLRRIAVTAREGRCCTAWTDARLHMYQDLSHHCMSACLHVCMSACLHVCMSACRASTTQAKTVPRTHNSAPVPPELLPPLPPP
ncbi:unnamed protein product [Chondrus crispus]|uniref:Uncharacterized protein n=1 Tax=Chondrus crispus TaxID=2769 RepID=R7QJR6_CHOCR|nr:unnamed protein product [Chondrus crispus]CDF37716.1 unnamed protein product [Chondrus crispus]|eukprot:XP_005717587.1 unnamed protein product [Chondrus crispus]